MLYEAMSHLDPVTGMPRGYLLITALPLLESTLFTLDIKQEGWLKARDFVKRLPAVLFEFIGCQGDDHEQPHVTSAIRHLVSLAPMDDIASFVALRVGESGLDDGDEGRCIPERAIEALLLELRGLPLFKVWVSNDVCQIMLMSKIALQHKMDP